MGETIDSGKRDFVVRTIRKYFPSAEILAFGSRVSGTAKQYSDLDIALRSSSTLSSAQWNALEEEFENSDLPFKVDLIDFSKADEDFQKIILKSCAKWA